MVHPEALSHEETGLNLEAMEKKIKEMFEEYCQHILPRVLLKVTSLRNSIKSYYYETFQKNSPNISKFSNTCLLKTSEKWCLKSPNQMHLPAWNNTQKPTKACNQGWKKYTNVYLSIYQGT